MIRRLALALLGLLALSGEARAHWDIWWDDPPPRLSPAQAARLDLLARRALGAMQALPADRRRRARLGLVSVFNKIGQCRRAEALLPGLEVDPEIWLLWAIQPALTTATAPAPDEWSPFSPSSSRRRGNADELDLAGALWRRLGDERARRGGARRGGAAARCRGTRTTAGAALSRPVPDQRRLAGPADGPARLSRHAALSARAAPPRRARARRPGRGRSRPRRRQLAPGGRRAGIRAAAFAARSRRARRMSPDCCWRASPAMRRNSSSRRG